MAGLSVVRVEMNVRVLSRFYGSVLLTRIRGKGLWLSLGPYKERNGRTECILCGDECECCPCFMGVSCVGG